VISVDIPALEIWWYPLLLLTGWCAGFVDSAAGGGGLITVPVLLQTGMPPQWALATNKLQASFGSGSACWHFAKAGLIDWKRVRLAAGLTLLGAALGAGLVNRLDSAWLNRVIPWILAGLALFTLFQPNLGKSESKVRCGEFLFSVTCGLGIGFYDGFFGPGTGTFWAMAHVLLLGLDLRLATARTKAMNFCSNLASLAVFLQAGQVLFAAGLCMGAGQWLGAKAGSKLVIVHGARWIRPLLITVTLALTARLFWLNFRGSP